MNLLFNVPDINTSAYLPIPKFYQQFNMEIFFGQGTENSILRNLNEFEFL